MTVWHDGLEDPHYSIAASTARRMGVLAGPGTGKTAFGLMRRVARLLSEGTDPERILLVSFTRTAAHDLREKIAALGIPAAQKIYATTLHAYCFGLLQQEAVLAITQRHPRPLLDHEKDMMLRDLRGEFGDIRQRREMLAAYEAGWARGEEDHPGVATSSTEQDFQTQVLRWLQRHKAMLIGEVIPLAYKYLSTTPLAPDLSRFDHVIVDEYQDLNWLEQRLVHLLAEHEDTSLCIAGDDDQSIYGFRHAHPEGIRNFVADGTVEDYEIFTCGRCPKTVLDMANALMEHAPSRDKPPLSAVQEVAGTVSVVQWGDVADEAEGIAAAIAAQLASDQHEPGDILVLVNRRQIGNHIRDRLRTLEIPAHSFFTEDLVASQEAQRTLALLQLATRDDPVGVRTILGLGDASARTAAYERLQNYCLENDVLPQNVLEQAARGESVGVNISALARRFEQTLAELEALPEGMEALVDHLFPEDSEAVAELREIALEAAATVTTKEGLLEAVVAAVTQVDVPPHPDYVRIMSLHKSKGLTSPVVYLAGLMDGIVPTLKQNLSNREYERAEEEQRRLLYVAITRAAKELTISYSGEMDVADAYGMGAHVVKEKIRTRDGQLRAPTIPSRYLSELARAAPRAVPGPTWLTEYASS